MASWDHDDLMDKSRNPFPPYPATVAIKAEPMRVPTVLTEPMRVLEECIEVLRKKGADYQNPNSRVKQAHYYEHGLATLMDIIQAKRLRLVSLIETFEAVPTTKPNFESIEDSFKDMANYCAIAAAWCRGKIEGQDPNRDILNRLKPETDTNRSVNCSPVAIVNCTPWSNTAGVTVR